MGGFMAICGALLYDVAYQHFGKELDPYLRTGSIGKYIYCAKAVQNGNFIDMTFEPTQTDGSVKDRMVISIPLSYVKFMATGAKTLPIGFTDG
jgi:hypothetical protein